MSITLAQRHFREYHGRRFEKEIKKDRKKGDFRNSTIISRESAQRHKKLIGRKMRNVLQKEKRQIINYEMKISNNLHKNIALLKNLSQKRNNKEIWKRRLNLVTHTRKLLNEK